MWRPASAAAPILSDRASAVGVTAEQPRQTGDVVLLTEATRCLLTREHGELEPRGEIPLKGKSDGVALWSAKTSPSVVPRPLAALPDPA